MRSKADRIVLISSKGRRFRNPPKIEKKPAKKSAPPNELADKAVAKEKRGFDFGKVALQFGLAAHSLAGSMSPAHAAEISQAQLSQSQEVTEIMELLRQRAASEETEFVAQRFDDQDSQTSLEAFAKNGRVYYKRAGLLPKDLTPAEAVDRLSLREPKNIYVELPSGKSHRINSTSELQRLDTFQGLALKPTERPSVVAALRSLDQGTGQTDGLYRDGFVAPEKRLNAFEAHAKLTAESKSGAMSALKGAAVGTAITVGAVAVGAFFPAVVPAIVGGSMVMAAGGVLAGGAALGAAAGYITHKNSNPEQLEVRRGQDVGLKIRNLDHAVETHNWLEERAANPFTDKQQEQALEALSNSAGLFKGRKRLTPEAALERLKKGKEIRVPSTIAGHSDTLDSIRQLQQLDTVRGKGINPVLPREVSESLRQLESGEHGSDGLFKRGKFEPKDRLSAFEAVDYLFREREPIGATVGGKQYQTKTLQNIQELNALKGDGKNTILPTPQFRALQYFDKVSSLKSRNAELGHPKLDSYEALQEMNEGRGVMISSQDRLATALEPADMHELRSLEVDKRNSILPKRDFELLQFWDAEGSYRVDADGQEDRAYEALQAVQRGQEFEVASSGRMAPALTFQDLQDLATFEAPEAGFPDTVPAEDFDRLSYFQGVNGLKTTQVGNRYGRAYEGYRELRDGKPFGVQAGGVMNTVTSSQSLHDLDAMLGRQENDILPQKQYDLLKHLGDEPQGEGMVAGGRRLNSYGTLQQFRHNRPVTYSFHGGDFGEELRIPTANLEALESTKELRDNQKEYDKYAYSVPEWKGKMERQLEATPELGEANLRYGRSELADGERHLSQGQSDLDDAERDLRRGQSDLSSAESDLRTAQWMPRTTTEYRRECDTDNHCTQVAYEEHNWARDHAISRARSEISSAESDIRRARSDISSAESEISQARREISIAEDQIADAKRLLRTLPGFEDKLSEVDESSYASLVKELDETIARMKRLSHVSRLDKNLNRQSRLIDNMETRPQRPDGWVPPTPRVQQ